MNKQLNLSGSFMFDNDLYNVFLEAPEPNVWIAKANTDNIKLESIGETATDRLEAFKKAILQKKNITVITIPLE